MPTVRRCPRCGYEPPKGKKVVIRIYASTELEKEWEDFSAKHDTKELAFHELLIKARAFDKLQERSRIAVEVSGVES